MWGPHDDVVRWKQCLADRWRRSVLPSGEVMYHAHLTIETVEVDIVGVESEQYDL
jgi:hypothetical protein